MSNFDGRPRLDPQLPEFVEPDFDDEPDPAPVETANREQQLVERLQKLGGIRTRTGRSYAGYYTGATNTTTTDLGGQIIIDFKPLLARRNLLTTRGPQAYRGNPNLTRFKKLTGFSYNTSWRLLRDPNAIKRFEPRTLAVICEVLRCQPGDFLKFEPGPARKALKPTKAE